MFVRGKRVEGGVGWGSLPSGVVGEGVRWLSWLSGMREGGGGRSSCVCKGGGGRKRGLVVVVVAVGDGVVRGGGGGRGSSLSSGWLVRA
jgi:hypothetical protein